MTETPEKIVEPNHHAHHPGFSGVKGHAMAVAFLLRARERNALAAEITGLRAGERIVDIGCGPGSAVAAAASLGAEAVGVDPSTAMLRIARLRWRALGADWRVGTAESVPVDAGWGNVVWSIATVHHWKDLEAGLAEVARVLQPGGRFLALERRIDDPLAKGSASHGWTLQQADTFAERCEASGYQHATVTTHAGSIELVAVQAERC